jgi:hypothetical protein
MSGRGESPGRPSPRPFRAAGDGDNDSAPAFPRWVRTLAVAYVWSRVVGPVGFFLLSGAACFLWVREREVDGRVLGLWLASLACPAFCAAFRWWFRRWGRRRWPDAAPGASLER